MLVLIRRTHSLPGELAGEFERRQSRQARGIAGVGLDRLPGAVVLLTLDRGGLEHDPGRGRRVIRLRVGIFDPAGQAEDQRDRRGRTG